MLIFKSELVGRNGENVASEMRGRQEGELLQYGMVRKVTCHSAGGGEET